MVVILSIAAALSGAMIVGPLTSYTWSEILLRRILSNRAALLDFWNHCFKESHGVMGALLIENPSWPKPEFPSCRSVIRAEFLTFSRMRRLAVGSFLVFAVLWLWLSAHYSSYWIAVLYLIALASSAYVNKGKGVQAALVNIFRATRLWMWVGPEALRKEAPLLHVAGVVNILSEVETTPNPSL